ncbi:MAG: ribosomal RNA small subunit methyltransferase A [Candidatus Peregrinibacteria bacterium Greene0416_19]|nr:MAG: ribosomal RNA small subunit methyltransferase A [Candidatus Peregrinibacteria bacterium Greene0416_19]
MAVNVSAVGSLEDRIRQFLASHGIKLNTNLGQHFLIDEDILHTIVETAAIEPGDRIIEIGPGIGVLTAELLKRAQHVTTIEIDDRFLPLMEEYISASGVPLHEQNATGDKRQLTLIHGNALKEALPEEPYKIVANIPYHITSPLLRHVFMESTQRPSSLTLLIQREVAEKICSSEHRGLLTILVGLFGTPQFVCKVPSRAFLPPPAVESAVLHIVSHPIPLADPETIEQVFRLTKIAFGQRRKMLRNTFSKLEGGPEALSATGIDPTRRPETLSVEEWIRVAGAF